MKKVLTVLLLTLIFVPTVYGRVTPNDNYQTTRQQFKQALDKISDSGKRDKLIQADKILLEINQAICERFDDDMAKLSAILTELRVRENMEDKLTKVAFGQKDNQIEIAEYWVNYAAEAIAYQKIQDYTPQIYSTTDLSSSVLNSKARLKGDLNVLISKILQAKDEVRKALN